MSSNLEITAVFRGERFRFANADGDVAIGSATLINGEVHELTIKGQWDVDELKHGQSYRFYGRWSNYTNPRTRETEKQFHFTTFCGAEPFGREGVISYLRYAGEGNGIGIARATKLWEMFGGDAVRILREDPERVAGQIKGLDIDQAKAASAWLAREQKLEAATIDVTNLLAGRGFPRNTARSAIKEWGNRSAERIKRDPYSLMNFRGCSFKRCDNLWLELGLPANRLRRQALCCWYAVASDNEGHTWFPVDYAVQKLSALVGSTDVRPASALKLAKRIGQRDLDHNGAIAFLRSDPTSGQIVSEGGTVWTAEGRKAWCEDVLATRIVEAERDLVTWPDVSRVEGITEHQREQLRLATLGPIGILGGGPGTGKSFSASRLIATLASEFGIDQIAVGCPTGKAAVRITEAMNFHGLSLRARTWHSLLGIGGAGDSGWGFAHDEANPFRYRVMVGDESSMNDTGLMSAILRARAPGTLLLLIGDVHQLPPVGHGAPLRDMIAAGVPYGELTEIKRQDDSVPNMIIQACADIRVGKPWKVLRSLSEVDIEAGRNLVRLEANSPEQQIEKLLQAISWATANGFDPIWDCQAIVAVNAKSPLSRKSLNELLQKELNPASCERSRGQSFSIRDKIVNLKNGLFKLSGESMDDDEAIDEANDQGEVYVANGELAEVIEVGEKHFTAKLNAPRRIIRIPRGRASDQDEPDGGDGANSDKTSTGCSWDLGYALSSHKLQGSEVPIGIVMLDEYPGARMVCSREWIYTSNSRPKKLGIEIGKTEVAEAMLRRVAIGKRKTFLRELILKKRAERTLAEM